MVRHGMIVAALCLCCVAQAADPPQPKATSSLDDELFQGLDEATKTPGLKPKTTPPKPASPPQPTEPTKPAAPAPNPLDDELLKQLEGGDGGLTKPKTSPTSGATDGGGAGESRPARSASDDPFTRLTEQIRDAEARLRRTETGGDTQRLQQEIVGELEKLITQIEQQQQQKQQSQSQQQKSPPPQPGAPQKQPGQQPGQESQESSQARDSQEGTRNTTRQEPKPGDLRSLLEKAWGALPERERQAVMQSSVDDFPAKYQYVIEEYFKTLLKREE